MHRNNIRKWIGAAAAAAMLTGAAMPAAASDDTEKAGLFAALGLSAADGKTTLSDNAGATEAALLTSVLIDGAGDAIARQIDGATDGQVLILAKEEALDLFTATQVKQRIALVSAALERPCRKGGGKGEKGMFEKLTFAPGDITAALATSTNFSSVTTSLSDRMLLNAVSVHLPRTPRIAYPADIAGAPAGGTILGSYQNMLTKADLLRACGGDDNAKAAIDVADKLAESLNTPGDKGGPTPLMLAAQYEQFAQPSTYTLRVAIEHQGGTAITRSGVWFTLGFPGAATISAGLVASYRLSNTADGTVMRTGFVTCAIAPIKFASVARTVLRDGDALTRCRTFGGPQPPLR